MTANVAARPFRQLLMVPASGLMEPPTMASRLGLYCRATKISLEADVIKWERPVQGHAIIPHRQITDAPCVSIDELRLG